MGDKGEGGVNNFKKRVTLFMDGPKAEIRRFGTQIANLKLNMNGSINREACIFSIRKNKPATHAA